MRYAIFSDIHANLEALEAVIGAYKKEAIDLSVCVGDIVGYGADPGECLRRVRDLSAVIVAGNHDWAVGGLIPSDSFNAYAKQAVSWTQQVLPEDSIHFLASLGLVHRQHHFTLVHGTLQDPGEFNYMVSIDDAAETFSLLDTDLCFVGHSHVPGCFMRDKEGAIHYCEDQRIDITNGHAYIINVGSVGQPRDGNPRACCCIYDTVKRSIELKRVSYNIKDAQRKIVQQGLPDFLADRLLTGR